MDEILRRLSELWAPSWTGLVGIIDILLVAFLIYRLLMLVRGTRAWKVLIGIGVFVLALLISEKLQLRTLHWVLERASLLAPVALVILFLPELRTAIEGFAKLGLWPERFLAGDSSIDDSLIHEVSEAVVSMSRARVGALIVWERGEQLNEITRNGVLLNAEVSSSLLEAIFYHGNPLHDGAAIIRQDRVAAAACRLPLSESPSLDSHFHMRHRAGLGVSEVCDAIVIIVSEERGAVSLAINGRLRSLLKPEDLPAELAEIFKGRTPTRRERGPWRRKPIPEEEREVDKIS